MGRKPKVELPPLDLSGASSMEIVTSGLMSERRPRRATTRERTKAQKTLDALVQKAYDAWVRAGRPDKFWESPGGHIRVPESQLVQVQRAIHSAGRLLNMKIRFGEIQMDGNYADVVFSAADRPAKDDTK